MKMISVSLLSEEEVAEANVYFDYLINAFDGVSYASSRKMEQIFAQRKKSLVQSSSLEREPWEPKNYQEWLNADRLSQQLKKNGVEDEAYFERTAISFFESWSRMPSQIKKEIWRDREIIAALYEQIDSWKDIPGFLSVGVAKRTVNAEERKAGILTFSGISGRIVDNLYEIAKIPRFLKIESSIYEYLDQERQLVPIILEWMEPPEEYSSSENLMLASGTDLLPVSPALAVQSGDVIFGRNGIGRYNESQTVTLTAFAVSDDRRTNLGLSVWHGFKAGYEEVYSCREDNNYTRVGQILFDNIHQKNQSKKLDIALIKIESTCQINSHLKWVNKPPQKPDLPIPDLPAQMYGGASGHQKGYINQGMMLFPGVASSTIPYFTATILSKPGDSGSLLVFGHESVSPVSDSLSKYMDKSSLDARMLAMLGMLVEGSQRGTNGAVAIFRPMLDIFAYLSLQPSL